MVPIIPESCGCSYSCPEEEALLEMAREALASRRLSFDEDESCSVLAMVGFPFKDCLVLAVESENPKMDFLHSMEQMTKAYNGLKPGGEMDWGFLEDLLTWFLRINNMKNQDVIVAAFVDLCLLLSSSS
ncbi:transcription repressor OFP13-like [Nicotiana tabacum]|uniref:Transcription repressor n=1 Tax=Nicotiana tabacum TaxID=4097 RepID=A0A1S4DEH4_TOBAC|nr:PREDICTED: transcription repressor OFP13-like [Nicotiana tabacum]